MTRPGGEKTSVSVLVTIGVKHLGFLESVSEVFPDAKWQHCAVHLGTKRFLNMKHLYEQEKRKTNLNGK